MRASDDPTYDDARELFGDSENAHLFVRHETRCKVTIYGVRNILKLNSHKVLSNTDVYAHVTLRGPGKTHAVKRTNTSHLGSSGDGGFNGEVGSRGGFNDEGESVSFACRTAGKIKVPESAIIVLKEKRQSLHHGIFHGLLGVVSIELGDRLVSEVDLDLGWLPLCFRPDPDQERDGGDDCEVNERLVALAEDHSSEVGAHTVGEVKVKVTWLSTGSGTTRTSTDGVAHSKARPSSPPATPAGHPTTDSVIATTALGGFYGATKGKMLASHARGQVFDEAKVFQADRLPLNEYASVVRPPSPVRFLDVDGADDDDVIEAAVAAGVAQPPPLPPQQQRFRR